MWLKYCDIDLDMVTGLLIHPWLSFGSLSWFWRCKAHPCPLSPDLGLWWGLEATERGFTSWSWFEYGHLSLIQPWSELQLFILIFKMQRTSMSFKALVGALEDAGGSWLGFGILILLWIWSWVLELALVFGFGYGYWLWLWFLLSRVKKICWFRGSGSGGFGFGWVWLKLKISQSQISDL